MRSTSKRRVTALLALSIAVVACSGKQLGRGTGASGVRTRCGDPEESVPVSSAEHLLGTIDYPDPPPTGGNHNPCWATWGVHAELVPPERWVHNLEHGGVVFLYNGSGDGGALAADDAAALTALVERLPRTLLTQYPELPGTFGAVAWGYRLVSDCLDVNAFERFYAEHFDRAPESIPDNPSCN